MIERYMKDWRLTVGKTVFQKLFEIAAVFENFLRNGIIPIRIQKYQRMITDDLLSNKKYELYDHVPRLK